MIAALYVERDGAYYGLEGVDPWPEERDARLYNGPWPVVAHPPCNTWCQLAPVNQARWGKMIGDDGGCFGAAYRAVQRWGGVLEHPAYSLAWPHFGITRPIRGQWTRSLWDDGWVTEVSQSPIISGTRAAGNADCAGIRSATPPSNAGTHEA